MTAGLLRFDAVDSHDPQACIDFLDFAASLAGVQDARRRAREQLQLQPGHRVLEIGCGTGADACELARLVAPRGHVVGVDLSQAMVDVASRRSELLGLPVEFRQADVRALPFPDESFDACYIDRVLHFLDSPLAALQEVIRVTRVGGRIAVREPDWSTLKTSGGDPLLDARMTTAWCARARDGSAAVGARLPRLFAEAGLLLETIRPSTIGVGQVATAKYLFRLDVAIRFAVASGALDRDDAKAWLVLARAGENAGTWRCELSDATAIGVRPHA